MKNNTSHFKPAGHRTLPILALFWAIPLFFTACEKDPDPVNDHFPEIIPGEGVFIINEGNFQSANASLGYYDKVSGKMYQDLFYQVNGEALGEIFQSITVVQDLAYLVVNNSGKIEVVDPFTLERQAVIEGLTSPRHLLSVSPGKAYVSDLFAGQLNILDLASNGVIGQIPVTGWNEELAMLSGMVVSAGVETGHLYFIDPTTDQLADSLWVGSSPVSFQKDAHGHLWVLCAGNWMNNKEAALVQVSRDSFQVLRTYMLPEIGQTYSALGINPDGSILYTIGDGVYQFNLLDPASEASLLIPAGGRAFYGLSVDPDSGHIYITDAVDFSQRGRILIYDADGSALKDEEAMHVPRGFFFF
jgi:DNA-binding beta-propeller fold protein YncE